LRRGLPPRRPLPLLLLILFAVTAGATQGQDWPQWGRSPQHQGQASVPGQPLAAILADFVYDPFTQLETRQGGGSLDVHYAAPLVDDTGVYMAFKTGIYVPCPSLSIPPAPCGPNAWNLQIWGVKKLGWRDGVLREVWTFESDWKPEPDAGGLSGWEPVFHPVLSGGFVYVPGFAGTVFKLSRESGAVLSVARPSLAGPSLFVAGGLAADSSGNIYYNAIRLNLADPWGTDVQGAWLVRIGRDESIVLASFAALVPAAPSAGAPCKTNFDSSFPWPPSPTAVPPTAACGSQRPGVNVIPAIGSDGTIYTVSRAHFNNRYAYLVAVRPDLTPLWAASLRDILNDGCDVLLPPSGTPGGCRAGANRGVDPATNDRPAGGVSDLSTASPVVLPDGSVLFGAVTSYNYLRGHLFKFSAAGAPLATYDFGWDITPAVFAHDGTYSILLKDNHYEVGSYCGDPSLCPPERGKYDLVSLDANLLPQWRFTNTNTESCARQPDGSVTCVSDHPDSFEWCVNQPAVDAAGVVYANSEDGFLYAVAPDGKLKDKIFLNLAIGAAYTPLSIDAAGRVFSQNNGHLFVVGNPGRIPQTLTAHPAARTIGAR
jgi:hypothetical protein